MSKRQTSSVFVTGDFGELVNTTVEIVLTRKNLWRLVRNAGLSSVQEGLLRLMAQGVDLADAADQMGVERRRARRLFSEAVGKLSEIADRLDVRGVEEPSQEIAQVFAEEASRNAVGRKPGHCPRGLERCKQSGVCAYVRQRNREVAREWHLL
jgi:hypothetical protein